MPEETVQPLDPAELAEIDAQYKPFPSFENWPKELSSADAWEHSRGEFEEISKGAADTDLREAQAVAMRAAAFDTGAIEGLYSTDRGLTLTVATQAAAWEQEVAKRGPDARAFFEAQLSAFELVLDQATGRFPKVTQAWIRRLHEETTTPQDTYKVHTPLGVQEQPLPKGEYKSYPNHVRTQDGQVHAYAPIDRTQSEMQRLVDEVDTTAFREAHPVVQASYMHYALAAIHPFADGNGRVARAVCSAYTYRSASVPLLVVVDRRNAYLEALAAADSGAPKDFVDFIGSATQEAMELVMDSLLTARTPQPEEQLKRISELYQGDSDYRTLDSAAVALAEWTTQAAEAQIDRLGAPETVRLEVNEMSGVQFGEPPTGFRPINEPGPRSMRITFKSAPPTMAEVARTVNIFPTRAGASAGSVRLQVIQTPAEHLTLAFPDVHPQLSTVAKQRVQNFLRRVYGEGLDALYEEIQENQGDSSRQ